jgi:5'-nucleotidase
MRILVTNDDGVFSPGLVALASVAARFGQVRVVAPDVEQSATSHSITIDRPLKMSPTPVGDFKAFRVNGTPADCVALGLYRLDGADLCLRHQSGEQPGHEVWYSGTVAAARQAALLGVPAAAFQLVGARRPAEVQGRGAYVERVIRLLLEEPTLRWSTSTCRRNRRESGGHVNR